MSQPWVSQPERGNIFWLNVIGWIARHLGRSVASLFLYPITLYFFATSSVTRRASREFLQRVQGVEASGLEVFRHHRYFAATILDRVYLLLDEASQFNIETFNAEEVLAYIEKGQGCLLLGAHLGSFEVLRATGVHDYRETFELRILMREEQNRSITQFLNVLAPEVAKTVLPIGRPDTMLRAKECLDAGGLVAMLADRVMDDDKCISCQFMGEAANFPKGPAILALALKVPVFTCFGLYLGGNRYQIYFDLLSDVPDVKREDRPQAIEEFTCRYARILEQYTSMAPYNWFNFYDFWQRD
ncbi:MAG: lipid A biosynthesis acyltransferase [Gammaproteobacteria bacterium]|nr:lipid A biosynthesis acyltransferase [Gammaproteobacteria bacterium]